MGFFVRLLQFSPSSFLLSYASIDGQSCPKQGPGAVYQESYRSNRGGGCTTILDRKGSSKQGYLSGIEGGNRYTAIVEQYRGRTSTSVQIEVGRIDDSMKSPGGLYIAQTEDFVV